MGAVYRRIQRGFTLTELMIVLGLAAIILAIGAPNFTQFRLNSRLSNTANDLLSALVLARTAAIQRQTIVSLCPSANPQAGDAAACTDGATEGWIVFADTDGDCLRDGSAEELVDVTVFDHSFKSNPLRINTGDRHCIAFASNGFRIEIDGRPTAERILICDNRGIAQPGMTAAVARGVFVTRTGRARVTRDRTSGTSEDISTWGLSCP